MIWMTLLACGWNQLPDGGSVSLEAPLWDATSAVATEDGVYFALPRAGGLALVPETGEPSAVDIGEGRVARMGGVDGSSVIVALVERTWCDEDDEKELAKMELVTDCPARDRVVVTDVTAIDAGGILASVSIGGRYNRLSFSDDGRFAVAYLDLSDPFLELRGVIDLTSVVIVDLVDARSEVVNVGFAADRVHFQADGDGSTTGVVILSRSEVAQLELGSDPWEVQTTYALALDPDAVVTPVGVDLTPDGRYALISVEGEADLYALDLVDRTINLIELAGPPTALQVSVTADRTVLTYGNTPMVEVLDHDRFELESYVLDETVNQILELDGTVVLYSDQGRKDAYRLDLLTGELVEYRLENPPVTMQIAPTGERAIAFTRPEGSGSLYDGRPGMEVLDLLDDDTQPFLLEGAGVGLAFVEAQGRLDALVLQDGIDYLYQLDLYSGDAITVDLGRPPVGLGTLPSGAFFISHRTPIGGVSFLDPGTGDFTSQDGFALLGSLDPILLVEAP